MSRPSSTYLPPTFALNATALDQYGPRHVSGGAASYRSVTAKSATMQSTCTTLCPEGSCDRRFVHGLDRDVRRLQGASCPESIIRGAASFGPTMGRAAGTKMSRPSSTSLPPTFKLNATALDRHGHRHVSGGIASCRSVNAKSTTMQSHHTGPTR